MRLLTEDELKSTMAAGMEEFTGRRALPDDFWGYFDRIPVADHGGFDFARANIGPARTDKTGRWHHVLVTSAEHDAFMLVVIDASSQSIYGHHLLDLPLLYGLREAE